MTQSYSLYFHFHEYGSTQWVLWSSISPTEAELVALLDIDFEPEKDEFIAVQEIGTVYSL